MIELISVETVQAEITKAEKTLRKCFDMLIEFRHGRGDFDAILNDFTNHFDKVKLELPFTVV